MDDNEDIYADLDEFYVVENKKADEKASYDKLVQTLRDENKDLKRQIKNIRNNFQSMLTTVRQEIKRKDDQLVEKQRIHDELLFKRRAHLCNNCSRPLDVNINHKNASNQIASASFNQKSMKLELKEQQSNNNDCRRNPFKDDCGRSYKYVNDRLVDRCSSYNDRSHSDRLKSEYEGTAGSKQTSIAFGKQKTAKEEDKLGNKSCVNDISRKADCRDKYVERSRLHNERSHSNRSNPEYEGSADSKQTSTTSVNQKSANEVEKPGNKSYSAYSYLREHESKNKDQRMIRSSSHNDCNNKYENDRYNYKYSNIESIDAGSGSHKYVGDISANSDSGDNRKIGSKYKETHSRNQDHYSNKKYKFSPHTENGTYNHKEERSVRDSRKTISSIEEMQGRHSYDVKTDVKVLKDKCSGTQRSQSQEKAKTEVRTSERLKQINKIEYKKFDSIGEKIITSKENKTQETDKNVKGKITPKKKDKKEIKDSNSEVHALLQKVKQSPSTQNKTDSNKQKIMDKNKRLHTEVGIVNPETLTVTKANTFSECADTNKILPKDSKDSKDVNFTKETSKDEKILAAGICEQYIISYETKSLDVEIVVKEAPPVVANAHDSKNSNLVETPQEKSSVKIKEFSNKDTNSVADSKLADVPDHNKGTVVNVDNDSIDKQYSDLIIVSSTESEEIATDSIDTNQSNVKNQVKSEVDCQQSIQLRINTSGSKPYPLTEQESDLKTNENNQVEGGVVCQQSIQLQSNSSDSTSKPLKKQKIDLKTNENDQVESEMVCVQLTKLQTDTSGSMSKPLKKHEVELKTNENNQTETEPALSQSSTSGPWAKSLKQHEIDLKINENNQVETESALLEANTSGSWAKSLKKHEIELKTNENNQVESEVVCLQWTKLQSNTTGSRSKPLKKQEVELKTNENNHAETESSLLEANTSGSWGKSLKKPEIELKTNERNEVESEVVCAQSTLLQSNTSSFRSKLLNKQKIDLKTNENNKAETKSAQWQSNTSGSWAKSLKKHKIELKTYENNQVQSEVVCQQSMVLQSNTRCKPSKKQEVELKTNENNLAETESALLKANTSGSRSKPSKKQEVKLKTNENNQADTESSLLEANTSGSWGKYLRKQEMELKTNENNQVQSEVVCQQSKLLQSNTSGCRSKPLKKQKIDLKSNANNKAETEPALSQSSTSGFWAKSLKNHQIELKTNENNQVDTESALFEAQTSGSKSKPSKKQEVELKSNENNQAETESALLQSSTTGSWAKSLRKQEIELNTKENNQVESEVVCLQWTELQSSSSGSKPLKKQKIDLNTNEKNQAENGIVNQQTTKLQSNTSDSRSKPLKKQKINLKSNENNQVECKVACQQSALLLSNTSGSRTKPLRKQDIELKTNVKDKVSPRVLKPKLKRKRLNTSNATVSSVVPKKRKCKNKVSDGPIDEIDKALNCLFSPDSSVSGVEEDNKKSIQQEEIIQDEEEMKEAIKSITIENSNMDAAQYIKIDSNLVNTTPGVILDLNNYDVSIDNNIHLNTPLVVTSEQLNEYEVIESFDGRTEIVQSKYNTENNMPTCIVSNSYDSVIYVPMVTDNSSQDIQFSEDTAVTNNQQNTDDLIKNNTELNNNVNEDNKLVTVSLIESPRNDNETPYIECLVTDSSFISDWNTSAPSNNTNNHSLNESQKSTVSEAKHMKVGKHEYVIECESPDVTTILMPGRKRRKRYPIK